MVKGKPLEKWAELSGPLVKVSGALVFECNCDSHALRRRETLITMEPTKWSCSTGLLGVWYPIASEVHYLQR